MEDHDPNSPDPHGPDPHGPDPHGLDPHVLRPGEAEELLAGLPWRRAVVFGGCEAGPAPVAVVRDHRAKPWPERVACLLRQAGPPELACLSLRPRRDLVLSEVRSRQLAQALAFEADLAVLACGGPDLRARSFDPDVVESELSRILASLKGATCRDAAVVSPFDWSGSGQVADAQRDRIHTRQRLLVERVTVVTLRHGALHIDLMAYEKGIDVKRLWSAHPGRLNGRGHAVAAAAVVRALAEQARTR
ncbi:hypothetical protein [Streptomyces sp. NBC_00212]|uniref:hypothetical protein n=1 Tax=Streptomyces sp. NBC_00212 TaxID=2975684 RepID=UPI00325346D6